MKGTALHELFHPSRIKRGNLVPREQKPGGQVWITPTVKKFVEPFKLTDEIYSLKPIIRAVMNLKPQVLSLKDLRGVYAKRTATDIIHSGKVAILSKMDRQKHGTVLGCVDCGIALVAALRAKGIKAQFARNEANSLVFFKFDGKEYSIDPSRYRRKLIPTELLDIHRNIYARDAKRGRFAIGRDAWDIGMTSFDDFGKYK